MCVCENKRRFNPFNKKMERSEVEVETARQRARTPILSIRDMEKLAQEAEKQARRPAPHRPDVPAPKRARADDAGDGGEAGEQAEQGE